MAGLLIGFSQASAAVTAQQKSFSSAEEAVKAAIAAARKGDDKELAAIFGPGSQELMSSGDPVADKQRRDEFLKAYDEKNRLETEGENTILVVGNDWPFPIPLVKRGDRWMFDTVKGKEEILNRRIGRNELDAIQVVLAYVDAQREYAMKDQDGDGLMEYAQQFRSDPGKKNGLYWQAQPGQEESPLGPFAARAVKEGYGQKKTSDTPWPFHGYYYRILTAQGKNAPGGAYSYLVKDSMVGGFALVAYPAEYGNSGVMTFIVNHEGKVFQKDLGKNTANLAQSMKEYNPDKTWSEVRD